MFKHTFLRTAPGDKRVRDSMLTLVHLHSVLSPRLSFQQAARLDCTAPPSTYDLFTPSTQPALPPVLKRDGAEHVRRRWKRFPARLVVVCHVLFVMWREQSGPGLPLMGRRGVLEPQWDGLGGSGGHPETLWNTEHPCVCGGQVSVFPDTGLMISETGRLDLRRFVPWPESFHKKRHLHVL